MAVKTRMALAPWRTLKAVSPRMKPADRARSRFFGTTADNRAPSMSARPAVIESMSDIHFGDSGCSRGSGRHLPPLLGGYQHEADPAASLIAPLEGEGTSRLGRRQLCREQRKRPTATPTPSAHPTRRLTVLPPALVDSNIRSVVVIVVGLMAIPIASGSIAPSATPYVSASPAQARMSWLRAIHRSASIRDRMLGVSGKPPIFQHRRSDQPTARHRP